jgi:leader peptidase (prepilin peptidase)/N-methyltransferase
VWDLPVYLYFAAVTVPLAVIDLRALRLPNTLTLSAYPIVAVLLLAPALATDGWSSYARAMLAGAIVLALFLVLHLVNPSGMGLGDVKLAGPMGAMLGWVSWQVAFVGVVVGFALAAIVGLAMILARRATRKSALPFGPFMLAGAWVAILIPVLAP